MIEERTGDPDLQDGILEVLTDLIHHETVAVGSPSQRA
jgi:hypothetical protein